MSRLIIGVIFGGRSVEHEISLLSAKSIIKNIDREKYEVLPIFIDKKGIWRSASVSEWINDEGKPVFEEQTFLSPSLNPDKPVFYELSDGRLIAERRVDAVFPVLHGTYGEDGTIQGLMEHMGIPFVGAAVLGSAVGMDKLAMKALLRDAGIPVVDYVGFYGHEWKTDKKGVRERIIGKIGFPCFVKSADLGSSIGITKVKSEEELDRAVDFSCRFSQRILAEKAVSNPREIEISVLGNERPSASCPGEIVPHREFYDYTAKYLEEGTGLIAPAELSDETVSKLKELAVSTFKALDCGGLGRVDFLIDGNTDEIFVSEINTMPGFTQISMYPKLWELSGISFKELISRLIDLAIERRSLRDTLESDIAESQKTP